MVIFLKNLKNGQETIFVRISKYQIYSIRLKNLRDGMEDYEYFAILERLAGRDAVNEVVERMAPNWWGFCRDPQSILGARQELAQRIQRAQGESQ